MIVCIVFLYDILSIMILSSMYGFALCFIVLNESFNISAIACSVLYSFGHLHLLCCLLFRRIRPLCHQIRNMIVSYTCIIEFNVCVKSEIQSNLFN